MSLYTGLICRRGFSAAREAEASQQCRGAAQYGKEPVVVGQ